MNINIYNVLKFANCTCASLRNWFHTFIHFKCVMCPVHHGAIMSTSQNWKRIMYSPLYVHTNGFLCFLLNQKRDFLKRVLFLTIGVVCSATGIFRILLWLCKQHFETLIHIHCYSLVGKKIIQAWWWVNDE